MHKYRRSLPATLYKITNTVNGKFYIGVTTRTPEKRFKEYISASKNIKSLCHFHKAIRRWGASAFRIETLMYTEDAKKALAEEVRLIADMAPHYNSTLGGEGCSGFPMSLERRQKVGESKRGNTWGRGKKLSDECKEKLRIHGKARKHIFDKYAALGPASSSKKVVCLNDGQIFESASAAARNYGLAKSIVIEVCQRNPKRAAAAGRVFRYLGDDQDPERQVLEANKRTAERAYKGSVKLKVPVICLNDGKEFPSAKEASEFYGIHRSFIGEVCRGEKSAARGYRFAYMNSMAKVA